MVPTLATSILTLGLGQHGRRASQWWGHAAARALSAHRQPHLLDHRRVLLLGHEPLQRAEASVHATAEFAA